MSRHSFMLVDAFTSRPLMGNACAIVFEADELPQETMLAVARELNQSETSFVMRSSTSDVRFRFFTPAEEIPLAGHPIVATVHALVESGRIAVPDGIGILKAELNAGVIQVEIHAVGGHAKHIVMSQMKPQFLSVHLASDVMPLFGLQEEDLLSGAVIETVSTGTPQLMVPLKGLAALKRARLKIEAYEKYRLVADFFSPHLFCLSGATPAGRTFARHFGTPPDVMEDPFTGSATGGMAAYLWRHGLIETPSFVAEQGHWMNRPGQATVEVIGPPTNMETVKVGGAAVTVMRGELSV